MRKKYIEILHEKIERVDKEMLRFYKFLGARIFGLSDIIKRLEARVRAAEETNVNQTRAIANLRKQMQCNLTVGHDFVYQKGTEQEGWVWINVSSGRYTFDNERFLFKCKRCDFEIELTKAQLTPAQRKALEQLGIIKPEKKKK